MTSKERLEIAKGKLALHWVRDIQKQLTNAGVPDTVYIGKRDLPCTDPASRLHWYLLRRKDVKPFERDADILSPADIAWIKLNSPMTI